MPHTDQLLVAAAHSKLDVVQRLVEQDGALMDARSEYGLTALMQVYPSPSARHLVISSSHHRHLGLSKKKSHEVRGCRRSDRHDDQLHRKKESQSWHRLESNMAHSLALAHSDGCMDQVLPICLRGRDGLPFLEGSVLVLGDVNPYWGWCAEGCGARKSSELADGV